MRTVALFCLMTIVAGSLLLSGCGSSDSTASSNQNGSAPAAAGQKPADNSKVEPAQKTETPPGEKKDGGQPAYDPKSSVPATKSPMPSGKFSVQIGAYKQQENADHVAGLAKERFGLSIYTIPDPPSGLVKVYVGDFASKDEARKFRDDMAQKYPLEYKDAWVSENPSK